MKSILISILIAALIGFIFLGAFIMTGLGLFILLIIALVIFLVIIFMKIIKNIVKIGIIALIILLIFFFFNANFSEKAKLSCKVNTDCVCGGKDLKTGQCFVGNVNYYKFLVNKKTQCPDFCTGIAGNLETVCMNTKTGNKCGIQSKSNLTIK
jgi:hypothetical protein